MRVNNAYFGAQRIQIGATLSYLEPQGKIMDSNYALLHFPTGLLLGRYLEASRNARTYPDMCLKGLQES